MTAKDDEQDGPSAVALPDDQARLAARRRAEEALTPPPDWQRPSPEGHGPEAVELDALIHVDAEGNVTAMNDVAERLTGWTRADAIEASLPEILAFVNETTRLPVENPALRALKGEPPVATEPRAVLIARDETEHLLNVAAAQVLDEAGQVRGALLICRERIEHFAREDARALLAAIVESSEDAIISKTLDGVVRTWNAGAERLFGYTAAEAIGQPITLIVPHERRDEELEILRRLRYGERIEHFETMRVAKDGRRLEISLTVSPLRDESGRVVGASKIARDVTERKRIERALRASEERHRFLSDLASATQQLTDPTEVMRVSARLFADHLGVDRCAYADVDDEATFVIHGDYVRDVPSIVGRWPVAGFGEECLRLMLANEPYVVDDADNDPRIGPNHLPAYRVATIQAAICVPLHKDGKFTASMAVHQKEPRHWTPEDVLLVRTVVDRCWETLERSRVTRTLRESEARYRAIVQASPECVKVLASDGTLLQMNRVGLRMIEADSAEQVIGRCVYDLIAPEYRASYREFNERVCRGESGTLEFEVVGLNGTRRHVETSAVPLGSPDGGYTNLAVTRDTTERKAAERELRESESRLRQAAADAVRAAETNAKFRAFFEQGSNFAAVLSLDGTLVEANRHCLDACGFRREDVIGKPFWECGWWSRSHALIDQIRDATHAAVAGQGSRAETPYYTADGSERIEDLIIAPVTDEWGRVLFIAATGADITDRRRMEDALREQDRRKNEFIALLGHELRNPLAPIRNGLQVMRLAGEDPVAIAQARAMMDRQLGHMVRLIDDLLDVSRIGQNKMFLHKAPVLLSDVVGNAIETARPMIEEAGHELVVALPTEPVVLDADLTRLAQVFSNLLTNSAKYTEGVGSIRLEAEQIDEGVLISVQDTGIGIPKESLPKIFDMFSQVDRSNERSSGGLGIGLSIVKALVEMHGGTVTASSDGQGKGSRFSVQLQAVPDENLQPGNASPPANGRPESAPKRRILVVDDNQDSARSMARVLKLQGDETLAAFDGIEALQVAEQFRPDFILMDVGMPRLNGYEATRQFREQDWGRSPFIIALTGWGQEIDRVQSREAGCDGHLVKPVNLADLETLMNELARNNIQPASENKL